MKIAQGDKSVKMGIVGEIIHKFEEAYQIALSQHYTQVKHFISFILYLLIDDFLFRKIP